MSEVVMEVRLSLLSCAICGMQFAVPLWWEMERRRDHGGWYCPNGHNRCFPAESDLERLQREKREAEQRTQARINEEVHARLVAERERDKAIKDKRRIERRISKGVCPCCNRTFEDLSRHMSAKHKGYALLPGQDPKLLTGKVQ